MTLQHMNMVMGGVGASDPFEPSGTWIGYVGNNFIYSRDGYNWNSIAHGGSLANYWSALVGSDLVFITQGSTVRKSKNLSIPDFEGAVGGDGIGACQWIAAGPAGLVATTTIQLRTSSNGILWTDADSSLPANWSTVGRQRFVYSPACGLYMNLGQPFSDQYFTGSSRTSWTQRTFPVNFQSNGQGGSYDTWADSGSIAIVCLADGSGIYSTTDGINWTLRHTPGASTTGAVWNPILGAFYVTVFAANPANLIKSTDGITWVSVAGNDLDDIRSNGELAVDPVKGIMQVATTSASSTNFSGTAIAMSLDGISWFPRYGRLAAQYVHVPGKYGPVVDTTLTITPDPINISDVQASPTTSWARLIMRGDGTIDRQNVSGIIQIGKWTAGAEGTVSPPGREYRLDQISGDALNFGATDVNTWVTANSQRLWGYTVTTGALSGTFTLRVRDRITLVEDTNGGVPVSISANSSL